MKLYPDVCNLSSSVEVLAQEQLPEFLRRIAYVRSGVNVIHSILNVLVGRHQFIIL